jgi:hypothetical protein
MNTGNQVMSGVHGLSLSPVLSEEQYHTGFYKKVPLLSHSNRKKQTTIRFLPGVQVHFYEEPDNPLMHLFFLIFSWQKAADHK